MMGGNYVMRAAVSCGSVLILAILAGVVHAQPLLAPPASLQNTVPVIELPRSGITSSELGLIVNSRDPLSVKIADYYQRKRGLPAENVIRVKMTPGKRVLSRVEFKKLKAQVDAETPAGLQAYALAWTGPFRVECMSITSAFALGFDPRWCASGCEKTQPSPYFNQASLSPYTDLGIRPTMMLAAESFEEARKLIDRGVRADGTLPRGRVYLLETQDKNRSVRKVFYPEVTRLFGDHLEVIVEQQDAIRDKRQVLLYVTGSTKVPDIATNHFLPGAIADHLTSAGGQLFGGSQMSALRWLEGGVTGSYGAVVEPCNFLEKFPNPLVVLHYYLRGNTLLEAYWKSVAMPGQGVFIGEPLASPYRGYRLRRTGDQWLILSPLLGSGDFKVLAANEKDGSYVTVIDRVLVFPFEPGILLPDGYRYLRIERLSR
jgi:uncharacterized protein (TIGR03790 family)